MTKTDKRDRANLFRQRLSRAMAERDTTQSGLARQVGVDRSTISQLLTAQAVRMPNAQVVAECATALGVSTDWLLGLSDLPERAADVLAASMQVTDAPRALVDEQIFAWHREADGFKIRNVPATLPDMLKTEDFLRWEYASYLGRTTDQAIGASRDRLALIQNSSSDYEIAMPLFELDALATASGYYAGIPDDIRRGQIVHMRQLHAQLYPSIRVYLFDARRLWSAPLTVFGPLVAVIYLGQHYLAFRDSDRVRLLSSQFDLLVREAHVSARDWPDHLDALESG